MSYAEYSLLVAILRDNVFYLKERHAKLAVGSSIAFVDFIWGIY